MRIRNIALSLAVITLGATSPVSTAHAAPAPIYRKTHRFIVSIQHCAQHGDDFTRLPAFRTYNGAFARLDQIRTWHGVRGAEIYTVAGKWVAYTDVLGCRIGTG